MKLRKNGMPDMRCKANRAKPPAPIVFYWCWHDTAQQQRRLWRSDWAGDAFDILTPAEFEARRLELEKSGFNVREADHADN